MIAKENQTELMRSNSVLQDIAGEPDFINLLKGGHGRCILLDIT